MWTPRRRAQEIRAKLVEAERRADKAEQRADRAEQAAQEARGAVERLEAADAERRGQGRWAWLRAAWRG